MIEGFKKDEEVSFFLASIFYCTISNLKIQNVVILAEELFKHLQL